MAAAQTAEQKAAADKAAAEQAAAEQTAADKAAAEKVAADAAAAEKPATSEAKPKHVVTGAAAVLTIKGGGESYLYKGAPVGDQFTAESVKHAIAVGLVSKAK